MSSVMPAEPVSLQVRVNEKEEVSALMLAPSESRAAFVFAHGAGAGMRHPFMESLAQALAQRRVATMRFQFPYMEKRLKRPDTPALAQAAVRAAVAEASRKMPGIPVFAGGKSFGGRMTSQAQAQAPMSGVLGLIFVGFPLHPAGNPSMQRADHLELVKAPMLFLQGTRDALADLGLVRAVVARLGNRATLVTFEDADHSFHVPKKSGSNDTQVLQALAEAMVNWMTAAAPGTA
jgi:predicted alpha/beta-hydrolase family hydrolase